MYRLTRRAFAAGLAASGAAALSGGPVSAAAALPYPNTAMKLSRRLVRGLGDGQSLTVYREWDIRFASQGRGMSVTGVQTLAKVDCPKRLRPIADIEEKRSTADMWPILLSAEGRIMAAGEFTREDDLSNAIRAAERVLEAQNKELTSKQQRERFLKQMQQAKGTLIEQLPTDLFFPATDDQTMVRAIDLPDGSQGEFTVDYSASRSADGPWLARSSRRFTTRIGDETRESSEEWGLSAI